MTMAASYAEQIAAKLAEHFGPERVRIVSVWHIKVRTGTADWHDVYTNAKGHLKCARKGHQRPSHCRKLADVIGLLDRYDHKKTDVAQAQRAMSLVVLMERAQRDLPKDVQAAVFVDAGWKDGVAQIGWVYVRRADLGMAVTADTFPQRTESPTEAERLAIEYGADFAPAAVVYSDCKSLVDQLSEAYRGRLRWLPRERNKVADKIANRRGQ